MTLNEVKTFVVGTIKQAFTNKKTLDKFDDSTGTLKYDGQKINNFPVFVADDAPVGNIIAFMGNTAPQDYLICDGTEYNITNYPLLAQHILDEFGSYNYFGGDGTATFAVPDLRGEFLRGSGTATRDTGTGSAVGEHQEPTQHAWICKDDNNRVFINGGSGQNVYAQNTDKFAKLNNTMGFTINDTSYSTWSASGNTHYSSRPTNTSVLYCIKYQITQNNISKDIVTYSLEEQCIGSWINGKPLYKKTLEVTTPDKIGVVQVASLTDLNIDNVINYTGLLQYQDNRWTQLTQSTVNNDMTAYSVFYIRDNSLYINFNIDSYINKPACITIQYTKTTDTENSFTLDMLSSISTLNTIASDEEVNEVIGGI